MMLSEAGSLAQSAFVDQLFGPKRPSFNGTWKWFRMTSVLCQIAMNGAKS